MRQPKSILITGASSGIGEALALEYAAPGVHLALSGRDGARLEAVSEQCRNKGAEVLAAVLDVTDRTAMRAWIAQVDSAHALDLVIANAGISGGAGTAGGENEDQARAIFDVNFTGVLNTIWPAIDAMRLRKRGQIAITSSIAGMTPLPGAPAYSTSKVAVKAYAEALHGALKPEGIIVTAICPGFVESRITEQNNFPMPFFLGAPKAARIIRLSLTKRRVSIIFPWPLAAAAWLMGLLPPCWRVWILSRAPKKT
ncbi:MAG: SDR family NAD(P)-dependent oxidoreductase [Rhodospirillales bacterium]|nr:SDR family NAD(P)-dependent oxidoreductase [Rhodospirillales bacterium]